MGTHNAIYSTRQGFDQLLRTSVPAQRAADQNTCLEHSIVPGMLLCGADLESELRSPSSWAWDSPDTSHCRLSTSSSHAEAGCQTQTSPVAIFSADFSPRGRQPQSWCHGSDGCQTLCVKNVRIILSPSSPKHLSHYGRGEGGRASGREGGSLEVFILFRSKSLS